jgi:hypothetical protein
MPSKLLSLHGKNFGLEQILCLKLPWLGMPEVEDNNKNECEGSSPTVWLRKAL